MSILAYTANVSWGPRAETPEALATRIIDLMTKIRDMAPLFSRWYTVSPTDDFRPFEPEPASLSQEIAARISKSDDGLPEPAYGYHWSAYNFDQPRWTPSGFSMVVNGGSYGTWACNSTIVSTADTVDADPSLISSSLFKSVLLLMAESFDANAGKAFSTSLTDYWTRGRDAPRLDLGWMTYLGPRFAHFANPPPSAIIEHRPDGGLLMAATDEVFSTEDPEHMAVARDIQAAVAPFNALKKPYPGLELPED